MQREEVNTDSIEFILEKDHLHQENHTVFLRDVSLSFRFKNSDVPVLQKLSLTVPRGTIYALLGPSGCGKTTTLRCIIGRLFVNEGTILTFGCPPVPSYNFKQRIGYMPQDIALTEELTTDETLNLFGTVAGMNKIKIQQRTEFLVQFLNMNYHNRKIRNLSGGQKRRVSLAVALIHEPALLILDEPTVGVDPPLRKRIWSYLNTLANAAHVTIIVTTHHIEEAHMADTVGLMLNGCLAEEAAPDVLVQKHKCATLEKVYFKLCKEKSMINKDNVDEICSGDNKALALIPTKQSQNSLAREQMQMCRNPSGKHTEDHKLDNDIDLEDCVWTGPKDTQSEGNAKHRAKCAMAESIKFTRIYALFLKNVFYTTRNPAEMVLGFVLPIMIITLCAMVIGKPIVGLPLGIVNQDAEEFGTLYLDAINNDTVTKVYYNNYEIAFQDSLNGKIWGVVHINSNFTNALIDRYLTDTLGNDWSLEHNSISIALDLSNKHIAEVLKFELLTAYQRFVKVAFSQLGINPRVGDLPFKYDKNQIYGNEHSTYDEFLIPAFLLKVSYSIAMALTSLALISDKKSGSLDRLYISGVAFLDVAFAQILMQGLAMIVQIVSMFVVVFGILRYHCLGSVLLAGLLSVLQGVCGMTEGILISVLCEEQVVAIAVNIAIFFFGTCLSGMIWPATGMAYYVKWLSRIWPQTYAMEAMRSIINRGWDFTYFTVIAGFSITVGWTISFIILAFIFARMKP